MAHERAAQGKKAGVTGNGRGRAIPSRRFMLAMTSAAAAAIAIATVAVDQPTDKGTETPRWPAAPPRDHPRTPPRSPSRLCARLRCRPSTASLRRPTERRRSRSQPQGEGPGADRTDPRRADRPLITFTMSLARAGRSATILSSSPVLEPRGSRQPISTTLPIPADLAAGAYDIVGVATWPGPSVCGVTNPPDAPTTGTSRGVIGSIVIS